MSVTERAEAARVPDFDELDRLLREMARDEIVDNDERFELRGLGSDATPDQGRYLRNRAFAITRDAIAREPASAIDMLRWLEQVVKTLDVSAIGPKLATTAFFSPGDACLRKLCELMRTAREAIDACVFTIADDRLTDELVAAHSRGVQVRIISDDDKQHDSGSDIERLLHAGIHVRLDCTPHHMHHKFAVFDRACVANGSFNWTRSASTNNFENLVVSADPYLLRVFGGQFERLWASFEA